MGCLKLTYEPETLWVTRGDDHEKSGRYFFYGLEEKKVRPEKNVSYYPYGLPALSWTREGEKETKEKFQGKEYEEKIGWADHGSRQYDPVLGRWFAVDPKGELMPYNSTYAAMGNNPVMMVDPDGELSRCSTCSAGHVERKIGGICNVQLQPSCP